MPGSSGKSTFNGKEYMDDWGFDLYYYGARFMDPVTGRFITPDPVKDYTNQYSYVGNNPVNRVDPTGMMGLSVKRNICQFVGQALVGLNEDSDDWFGKNLQSAWDAIMDAKQAAEAEADNAAKNGNEEDKKYWNGIAETLSDILKNNWYGVDYSGDETKGARYAVDEGSGPMLWINVKYLNSEHSDYLTGFILHEGAHAAYAKEHLDSAKLGAKDLKPKSKAWDNYWSDYNARSEDYAWRGTVKYFHAHKPSSTAKTNQDVVNTFNKIENVYNSSNMDNTIEYIMRELYPALYPYWRKIK